MFCCKCSAENRQDANFCFKCGSSLYTQEAPTAPGSSEADRLKQDVKTHIEDLLRVDRKSYECHACGQTDNLHNWDFALGKKISTRRAWSGTALSAAISIVTLPLLGAGGLLWPGKTTRYEILRLKLVLCNPCWAGGAGYAFHPGWQNAIRLGFTELFDAEQLKKLELVK